MEPIKPVPEAQYWFLTVANHFYVSSENMIYFLRIEYTYLYIFHTCMYVKLVKFNFNAVFHCKLQTGLRYAVNIYCLCIIYSINVES